MFFEDTMGDSNALQQFARRPLPRPMPVERPWRSEPTIHVVGGCGGDPRAFLSKQRADEFAAATGQTVQTVPIGPER